MRHMVAGRHYRHALRAKNDLDGIADGVAISRTDKKYTRVLC